MLPPQVCLSIHCFSLQIPRLLHLGLDVLFILVFHRPQAESFPSRLPVFVCERKDYRVVVGTLQGRLDRIL